MSNNKLFLTLYSCIVICILTIPHAVFLLVNKKFDFFILLSCGTYLIYIGFWISLNKIISLYKTPKNKTIPIHQFTYIGDKVLLLRSGEIGYGDFQWPKSGKVICPKAKANPEQAKTPYCGSGGLFGWPWGIGIGNGKTPDFTKNWIVFAANPQDVIPVDYKAKAIGECEVIHCGPWYECFKIIEEGKLAWLKAQNNNSVTSENYSTAATSGDYSTAATSGDYSTAITSGPNSTAATSGDYSTTTTSGDYSTAATSGDYSTAITNKNNSIAVGTGQECEIKALGKHSIAAATGKNPTIEVIEQSVGVVIAEKFTWYAHPGTIVLQKWDDGNAVLRWDGPFAIVLVNKGRIINNLT